MITLQVQQLSKKFNRNTIFSELSFSHEDGVLGIAGANGSGKSTLLKCLAYLLRPHSGSIIWKKNEQLMNQKQLKTHLGFAAPYINLYEELSVLENLTFLLEAGGHQADQLNLQDLLERVQIPGLAHQRFGSLSTGQQQRAKLAVALVRDPEVLMLDEPGSNLDEKGHALVQEIVEEARKNEKLVILASNDAREIAWCDEVLRIEA